MTRALPRLSRLAPLALALALALATAAAAPPAARAAEPEIRTYTVQPGDSVWSIAEEFYGSGQKYTIIYKYNRFIGRPPFLLRPGQVLRLPVGDKLPEAQVHWTQREVLAKPPRALDWLEAREQMNLWKLYKVSTGDASAVHIIFEDESDLRLRENALLVIYGGSAAKSATAAPDKTRVVLEQGTLRGGLARLDRKQPLVVETPSGQVDLFAKLAQVQVEAASAMISVYDGQARVKAQGAEVAVGEGFGTVVKKGKPPEPARPLPAVPGWAIAGSGDAVALVPDGGRASFRAAWQPVAGAAAYRVELARDAAFTQVHVDVLVDAAAQQAFLLQDIEAGAYFARIAARDADGLEGAPSPALRLDVVAVKASRRLAPEAGGVFTAVGFNRLTLDAAVAGELEWRVGDAAFTAGDAPVRLDAPGTARVAVRRRGATVETPFTVEILAVTATVAGLEPPLVPGETRALTVSLRDTRGRPAALPGVDLTLAPVGAVPLTLVGPGTYTATVAIPAGATAVTWRLAWPGGALVAADTPIAQPVADAPFVYRWVDEAPALGGDDRFGATPLVNPRPVTRFTTALRLVDRPDETALGLGLGLEGALGDDGALGLDAGVTLLRATFADDPAGGDGLGDAVLGARLLVLDTDGLLLAPSLRLRLPLFERDGARVFAAEPGVLLRVPLGVRWWLDTRQALVLTSDFGDLGGRLAWAGTVAVSWRFFGPLTLTGAVDASAALAVPAGQDGWAAFGAVAGLQLELERFRLGLVAGLGLGDDGRAHLGRASVGLTLDIGLGGP